MEWTIIVAVAAGIPVLAGLGLFLISRFRLRVEFVCDERRFAETEDGFRLALYRFQPATRRYAEPIILCHGLGANRYNLAWPGEYSLAERFRDLGFEVWVSELRGCGLSDAPGLFTGRSWRFTFDDLLKRDMDAILRAVRDASGSGQVLWLGHSMGGMLALAYLGSGGSSIKAAFALASPCRFAPSALTRRALDFVPFLARIFPAIHQRFFSLLLAPLYGFVPIFFFASHILNPRNVSAALLRRVMANLPSNLSTRLLMNFRAWLDDRRFASGAGFDFLEGLARSNVPLGIASGSDDRLAPPASVRPAFEMSGATDKVYREFGRAQGDEVDYGHGDIVFGRTAPTEVFPFLTGFFTARATPLP